MDSLDSVLNVNKVNLHEIYWKRFNALANYLSQSLVVGDNSWGEHYKWFEINQEVKVKVEVTINTIYSVELVDNLFPREGLKFDKFQEMDFQSYADFLGFVRTQFCPFVHTIEKKEKDNKVWKITAVYTVKLLVHFHGDAEEVIRIFELLPGIVIVQCPNWAPEYQACLEISSGFCENHDGAFAESIYSRQMNWRKC